MKLINSKVEIIEQEPGISGIYKQIEIAGRTAYKSEDKITEDSAKSFVDMLIKNGHGAALEHGTVYLQIPRNKVSELIDIHDLNFYESPYVYWNYADDYVYITTNYRALLEHHYEDLLEYVVEPTDKHKKRITVRFTCDRGVSHEFVRHRVFSFLQESTRFCNYSKDKYGNQLTFIIPEWVKGFPDGNLPEGDYYYWDGDWCKRVDVEHGTKTQEDIIRNADNNDAVNLFLWGLSNDETYYLQMVNKFGLKPQEARQILPNALKTELIMTGTVEQWDEFFRLRRAPNAHPDARKLADELYNILYGQED